MSPAAGDDDDGVGEPVIAPWYRNTTSGHQDTPPTTQIPTMNGQDITWHSTGHHYATAKVCRLCQLPILSPFRCTDYVAKPVSLRFSHWSASRLRHLCATRVSAERFASSLHHQRPPLRVLRHYCVTKTSSDCSTSPFRHYCVTKAFSDCPPSPHHHQRPLSAVRHHLVVTASPGRVAAPVKSHPHVTSPASSPGEVIVRSLHEGLH